MATRRFCDLDNREITENDWTFSVDLRVVIQPDKPSFREPTIGGPLPPRDYTPIKGSVDDVCEPCAREIARTMQNLRRSDSNE